MLFNALIKRRTHFWIANPFLIFDHSQSNWLPLSSSMFCCTQAKLHPEERPWVSPTRQRVHGTDVAKDTCAGHFRGPLDSHILLAAVPGRPSQGRSCPHTAECRPRAGAAAVFTARCDCVFKVLRVSPARVLTNVPISANRLEVRRRAFYHALSSPLWSLTDPPPPSRPEPGATAVPQSFANDEFSHLLLALRIDDTHGVARFRF